MIEYKKSDQGAERRKMNPTGLTDKDKATILNTMNSTGIFVTCGKDPPNIMVAHWGAVGKMWGRDI